MAIPQSVIHASRETQTVAVAVRELACCQVLSLRQRREAPVTQRQPVRGVPHVGAWRGRQPKVRAAAQGVQVQVQVTPAENPCQSQVSSTQVTRAQRHPHHLESLPGTAVATGASRGAVAGPQAAVLGRSSQSQPGVGGGQPRNRACGGKTLASPGQVK
jgi:hypothetical protein